MKFGVVLPGGTAAQQLEQAVVAEDAGWDGVFVWEAARSSISACAPSISTKAST
jgi:alkanesulfonate monooxygenase SsuD/methylene tetrahydromethanopterin reductase-like flavin-dependent oxidoreductase (luciferase family)